jgi:hypothetical protein
MSISVAQFPASGSSASRLWPQQAVFACIVGMAVFGAVLWAPAVLRDADTLWHIAAGNWILAHRAVPGFDPFSFTALGHPWVAHEWLSEVLLALAYDAAGWNGLMVLTASAAGLSAGIVSWYLRQHLRIDHALALVVLTVSCGEPSLLARPHLIALPVLTLWTVMLVSARTRGTAPSLVMLPLMTLWANLHGGFLVGLVLAAALAAEAAFDPASRSGTSFRAWAIFILGAVVASCLTPQGLDGLLFPFRLMSMKSLGDIQEWKPTDMSNLSGVTGSVLVALYIGLTGKLVLPKYRVLLLAVLLFATMQHVRNAQLFGIVAPLLIVTASGSVRPAKTPEWLISLLVCLAAVVSLCFRVGYPLERADADSFASAALASVPDTVRARPVLNEYAFGGLLIFSGIQPFIDGRADLYGDEGMQRYLSIVRGKADVLEAVLCQYNIGWTMFPPASVVPEFMDREPGWRRIYTDKLAIIHMRVSDDAGPGCRAEPTAQSGSD